MEIKRITDELARIRKFGLVLPYITIHSDESGRLSHSCDKMIFSFSGIEDFFEQSASHYPIEKFQKKNTSLIDITAPEGFYAIPTDTATCEGCYFQPDKNCYSDRKCLAGERVDQKFVIFRPLSEKR